MESEYASKIEQSPIDFQKMRSYCLISVNIVCNLLIVAAIRRSKNLKTRTNKMIFNFALIDSLYLIHRSGAISYISEKISVDVNEGKGFCLMGVLEVAVLESRMIAMLLLLSNAIKNSDGTVFTIYHLSVCLLFGMCSQFCLPMKGILMIFQMTVFLIVRISIACLLIKEVYRYFCNRLLGKETTFWMNVARTCIYSWLIFMSLFVFTDSLILSMLFRVARYLSALTLFIYLIDSNNIFNISLLELLRCRSTNTNSETVIQIENGCSSPQTIISIPAV